MRSTSRKGRGEFGKNIGEAQVKTVNFGAVHNRNLKKTKIES